MNIVTAHGPATALGTTARKRRCLVALAALASFLAVLLHTHGPTARTGRDAAGRPACVMRSADFLDSIGVNVHLTYTDADAVLGMLRHVGIHHVRDWLNPDLAALQPYRRLAEAGIRLTILVPSWQTDLAQFIPLVRGFVRDHPQSVAAIEGPNEVNNWPIEHYKGFRRTAAATAFQADLFDAVRAEPLLQSIPVYNLTSYPDLPGKADDANFHSYPKRRSQPGEVLRTDHARQQRVMPAKPMVLTEAGYYSLPNDADGVDELAQAGLTLHLLFDAAGLGVVRSFLYQVYDGDADPGGSDPELHYGLFDSAMRPKPVATAIRNLNAILRDTGVTAHSFSLRPLPYSFIGLPETAHSLLLEKSDGAYDVVIWNEAPLQRGSDRPAAVAGAPVTLDFGGVSGAVKVFDPVSSAAPLRVEKAAARLDLVLGAHPLVVAFMPAATGPVAGP